jgi:hypothetical protein
MVVIMKIELNLHLYLHDDDDGSKTKVLQTKKIKEQRCNCRDQLQPYTHCIMMIGDQHHPLNNLPPI